MYIPMSAYMRVGIIHFMAYPVSKGEGPIAQTFQQLASDPFFEVIEVTQIKEDAVRKQVASMAEIAHVELTYGAQPRLLTNKLNINDLDETKRQAALKQLKEGIDEAYAMHAKAYAFLSGPYEEATKEASYQALVASTKELCAYAEAKGPMPISLEVFDYDVDKKSLIGPAPLAARFAKEIRKEFPFFGLLVDLSHIPLLHETIEESLEPVRHYITHAHMGNCVVKSPSLPGYGDLHPRFGFPGGENDTEELARYLSSLLSIGYLSTERRPVVSFEVKPFSDEDPALVIANAKRTLLRAWDLVCQRTF
ncbi:sugar phosphate isomerase/epimerase family protein [Sphaerochaeta sp.]|uniref:sugar phosphate isomerase/epimerase family protein n=1 Tax=Sphaerochaeta sp. TaxID=1972642 RepID=UPI002FCA908B